MEFVIKYVDYDGNLKTVDPVQYRDDFKEGKVPAGMPVFLNGQQYESIQLLDIVEGAIENFTIQEAENARIKEQIFQKTAPWYLKPVVRFLINWGVVIYFFHALTESSSSIGALVEGSPALIVGFFYWHLGGYRYNPFFDMCFIDQWKDIQKEMRGKKIIRKMKREQSDNNNRR